jgi:hypothetical protein
MTGEINILYKKVLPQIKLYLAPCLDSEFLPKPSVSILLTLSIPGDTIWINSLKYLHFLLVQDR